MPAFWRSCLCGRSAGRYNPDRFVKDESVERTLYDHVQIIGEARTFGISNQHFQYARQHNHIFTGWFYGDLVPDHDTIEYMDNVTVMQAMEENKLLVHV